MRAAIQFGAFITLFVVSFGAAASTAQPALMLVDGDGVLYVVLSNHGDQPVKLRKDFLLDSLAGSLSFHISKSGLDFPLSATMNPVLPAESTYIVLPPGAITGRVIGHWQLAHMYGLSAGCYKVSATYRDHGAEKFAALGNELRSPAVRLCIGDDESGIPLTPGQATNLVKNALGKVGRLPDGWSVTEAKEVGDFYRFVVRPSSKTLSEVFVERRTAEIWLSAGGRCARYEKAGLSASYAPKGEAPAACRVSPLQASWRLIYATKELVSCGVIVSLLTHGVLCA